MSVLLRGEGAVPGGMFEDAGRLNVGGGVAALGRGTAARIGDTSVRAGGVLLWLGEKWVCRASKT